MGVTHIWSTPDAEKLILYMARVSNPKGQNSGNTALLRYLIDHKHWSPYEMAAMAVEITTSRAISAQILRHRSFHFQEFSQRYAQVDAAGVMLYEARRRDVKNRQNTLDDLPEDLKEEWNRRQIDNWHHAMDHYVWAINHDIGLESARMVLPLQTSTRMYMSGTLRDWIHYILVRTDPSTQKEHRDIALEVKDIFGLNFPLIYAALGWE